MICFFWLLLTGTESNALPGERSLEYVPRQTPDCLLLETRYVPSQRYIFLSFTNWRGHMWPLLLFECTSLSSSLFWPGSCLAELIPRLNEALGHKHSEGLSLRNIIRSNWLGDIWWFGEKKGWWGAGILGKCGGKGRAGVLKMV